MVEHRQDKPWINVIPVAVQFGSLIDDHNSMFRRQPNKSTSKPKPNADVMQEYVDMSLKQQTQNLKGKLNQHQRKLSHVVTKPHAVSKFSTTGITGLTPTRIIDDSSATASKKAGLTGYSPSKASTKQLLTQQRSSAD